MPDNNHKPNSPSPSEIEKLLEIELMQKRAAWKEAKARHGIYRSLSFLFLFVVIAAVLVGFLIFFSSSERRAEMKPEGTEEIQPSPTPVATPE